MIDFQQAAVALLASMVLVLAGMIGWLYWQQQRLFQNMNNIVTVIGELASRPATTITFPPPQPEPEPEHEKEEEREDDRVSVDETSPDVPIVDGPPALDTDDLESKTKKELQDILTKRGLPFNRSDNKTALISLLKATA